MRGPKRPFIFYSKLRNFAVASEQPSVFFIGKYENLKTVHKRPFVLSLRNTKFLKLHLNVRSFFDQKRQNLKLYSNGHSFFWLQKMKKELHYLAFRKKKTKKTVNYLSKRVWKHENRNHQFCSSVNFVVLVFGPVT